MISYWWVVPLLLTLVCLGGLSFLPLLRRRRQQSLMRRARDTFHRRREWLEARFLKIASSSGTPRGLSWADCDFDDKVAFARDRHTGGLRALVAVTIKFEAIEGGGMEDVAAVANHKAATVVFRYENGEWLADGRPIMNLNPAQTIERFQHELEGVE